MSDTIAVFDSGLGGLTVVYNLQKKFPGKKIVYFGDTARLPYGNKSPETIRLFARQNTRFLLKFRPQAVVVACHTASALALKTLQREFALPIVGVQAPGVKAALRTTRNNRIGVIGTIATVRSRSYPDLIRKLRPDAEVFSAACPLFVPLVEEGLLSGPIVSRVVSHYLSDLKGKNIDTLVLACTHYPMLKKALADFMGRRVELVDPSEEVVREIEPLLARTEKKGGPKSNGLQIYLSDVTDNFRRVAADFLGKPLPKIQKEDTACKPSAKT